MLNEGVYIGNTNNTLGHQGKNPSGIGGMTTEQQLDRLTIMMQEIRMGMRREPVIPERRGCNFENREIQANKREEQVKIPPFNGGGLPDKYFDWEQRVEQVFECYEYDELTKVRLIA